MTPKNLAKITISTFTGLVVLMIVFGDLVVWINSYQGYYFWVKMAAKLRNVNLCKFVGWIDHGDYKTPKVQSEYFCIADFAVETEDIELCGSLDGDVMFQGTTSQKNKCLVGLAKKMHKPELCDELSLPGWRKYESSIKQSCRNASVR